LEEVEVSEKKAEIESCQIGILFDLGIYDSHQKSIVNNVKLIVGSQVPDKILNRLLVKPSESKGRGIIQADVSSNEVKVTLDWPLARNDAFARGLFLKTNVEILRARISIGNEAFSLFDLPQKHLAEIYRLPGGWFIDLTSLMQQMTEEGLDVDSAPSLKELTIQLARFQSAEHVVLEEVLDLSLQGIALENAKYVFSNFNLEPGWLADGKAEIIFPNLSHLGEVKASGGKLNIHSWLTSGKCSAKPSSFVLQSSQLTQVFPYLQDLERFLGFSTVRDRLHHVQADQIFIPKLIKYHSFDSYLDTAFVAKPLEGLEFQYLMLHSLEKPGKKYKIQFDFDDGQEFLTTAEANKPIDVWSLRREKTINQKIKSLKIFLNSDNSRLPDGMFLYTPQLIQKKDIDANLLLPFKLHENGENDKNRFSLMSVDEILNQKAVISIGNLQIPFEGASQSNIHPSNMRPKDILLGLLDKPEEMGFLASSNIFTPADISLRPGASWSAEEWHRFITPSHWVSIGDDDPLVFLSLMTIAFITLGGAWYLRGGFLSFLARFEKTAREFVNSHHNAFLLACYCLFILIAMGMYVNALTTNLSSSDIVVRFLAVLCLVFGVLEQIAERRKSSGKAYAQLISANLHLLLLLAAVALSISTNSYGVNYFTVALSILVLAWRFCIIVIDTTGGYIITVQALMLTILLGVYYVAYIDDLYTSILRPLVDVLSAFTLSYLLFSVCKNIAERKPERFSGLFVNSQAFLFLTALITGCFAMTLFLSGFSSHAIIVSRVTLFAALIGGVVDWFKLNKSYEPVREEN
jgi:hypothetical protein